MSRLKGSRNYVYPILLDKNSKFTDLLIMDFHEKFAHSGTLSLLTEIRKRFQILKGFSVVKKVLKSCVTCRRFKERTVKLNQSLYREFRVDPPQILFKNVFVDYFGPFYVKNNKIKTKVQILCIACTWESSD